MPKLLLADDSPTIRKVVDLTFSEEGVEVITAADAPSAMNAFVNDQPDIVLVDVSLAETSGYKICEMIKHDEGTRHIPVLLLVGAFEPFDQDLAERVGADGFVTKPFKSIRELVSTVNELLGTSRSEEDAAAVPVPHGNLDTVSSEDTADIENLYASSFAQTAEIDQFDTVEDLLKDAGLDDELIEASYFAGRTTEPEEPAAVINEALAETKEFDWSPASIVTEQIPEPPSVPDFEPKFTFDDEQEDAATEEDEQFGTDKRSADAGSSDRIAEGLSDEDVHRVAEIVISRLSDKLVREIAQKAVPEIAEKLIREALETNKEK